MINDLQLPQWRCWSTRSHNALHVSPCLLVSPWAPCVSVSSVFCTRSLVYILSVGSWRVILLAVLQVRSSLLGTGWLSSRFQRSQAGTPLWMRRYGRPRGGGHLSPIRLWTRNMACVRTITISSRPAALNSVRFLRLGWPRFARSPRWPRSADKWVVCPALIYRIVIRGFANHPLRNRPSFLYGHAKCTYADLRGLVRIGGCICPGAGLGSEVRALV